MSDILIVDDDNEFRDNLSEILKDAGYPNEAVSSADEAIEKLTGSGFDVILLDFMMPEKDGLQAVAEFKKLSPQSKVIMITAFASIENAVRAIKNGVSEYISKPFKIEHLLLLIRQAREEIRFESEVKKFKLEDALSSLSNAIRRAIIRMFQVSDKIRLMEAVRKLDIEDHTKVLFHLKSLKETGFIAQNDDRSYSLTQEGKKILECLIILDSYMIKSG